MGQPDREQARERVQHVYSKEEILDLFNAAEEIDVSAKNTTFPAYDWFYVPGVEFTHSGTLAPIQMYNLFHFLELKNRDLRKIFGTDWMTADKPKGYLQLGGLELEDREGWTELSSLMKKPLRVFKRNDDRYAGRRAHVHKFTAFPDGTVKAAA